MAFPPFPSNGETNWGNKIQTWSDAVEGEAGKLRIDRSVGTRVFVDDPGGSVMIHGDTGWRNVSSLLHTQAKILPDSGFARLRLYDQTAYFDFRGVIGDPRVGSLRQNTVAILNIPQGATQRNIYGEYIGVASSGPHVASVKSGAYVNRMDLFFGEDSGVWVENDQLLVSVSWSIGGWPNTMFGTAL